MSFIVENWYLILIAIVSGVLLLWPSLGKGGGGGVSVNEAVQMINREKAVVIDIEEPATFAAGHVSGARNLPLGSLTGEPPKGLPTNKALPLIVVCSTGGKAGKGVAALKALGFENARALAGGLAAWREANMPVEKSA